jgi:hypothetical protein
MDLGVAGIAHAPRVNRRGRGRVGRDRRTTRRINKRKRCRVQERCHVRRAGAAKDATALSAMLSRKG